ncbi:unnamed protein product [Cyprideis torosa]|uniref:Uncharacterized protein n=1 Tax=Cyprideis torosa TaxID=163714 RepID=A0A7R8ZRF4_9CRUS|nr:unnamed protein product [Cyprideis torosa]CAG0904943.1 unnamed protein product [Cyprideis torosa]
MVNRCRYRRPSFIRGSGDHKIIPPQPPPSATPLTAGNCTLMTICQGTKSFNVLYSNFLELKSKGLFAAGQRTRGLIREKPLLNALSARNVSLDPAISEDTRERIRGRRHSSVRFAQSASPTPPISENMREGCMPAKPLPRTPFHSD